MSPPLGCYVLKDRDSVLLTSNSHNLVGCCLVTKLCLTLCDPWTVSHQAPLFMGFPRQEYWSGLLFLSAGDLAHPGIELGRWILHL